MLHYAHLDIYQISTYHVYSIYGYRPSSSNDDRYTSNNGFACANYFYYDLYIHKY